MFRDHRRTQFQSTDRTCPQEKGHTSCFPHLWSMEEGVFSTLKREFLKHCILREQLQDLSWQSEQIRISGNPKKPLALFLASWGYRQVTDPGGLTNLSLRSRGTCPCLRPTGHSLVNSYPPRLSLEPTSEKGPTQVPLP